MQQCQFLPLQELQEAQGNKILPFVLSHWCFIIVWHYESEFVFICLFTCRDSVRAITSLPVSPCSSPLRHYGPAHKSGLLSPPHPAYAMMGHSGYNSNDYSSYTTMRPSPSYTFDPWRETSPYRAHTPPGGSPRTRPIWLCKYQQNQKIFPSLSGMLHGWIWEDIVYSCPLYLSDS